MSTSSWALASSIKQKNFGFPKKEGDSGYRVGHRGFHKEQNPGSRIGPILHKTHAISVSLELPGILYTYILGEPLNNFQGVNRCL